MSITLLLLTSYVLNAVWQVAVFGAAGWGLVRCVIRIGPELQHKVWVASLILATVVPATPIIQSCLPHQSSTGEANVSWSAMLAPVAVRDATLTGSGIVLQPLVIYLVSGFYIASLLFFSLRLCWVIRRTAALVDNALPASTGPEHESLWLRSKESFSVPRAAMLRSRDVPGPVTVALWRPVLLLPPKFIENHSPAEFLSAIGHECAHIKRNDFWKNVFYEFVSLLTAFHPVTWLIKSQIAQTREMVCDGMAAKQLPDRRAYAQSLLQLASKMPRASSSVVSHAVGMFDSNILERRVMTLTSSQQQPRKLRRFLSGVTAILLLLICAGVSGLLAQSVATEASSSSAQPSTGKKQAGRKDLSCTYYENDGYASLGTCGFDKKDKSKYRCYSNEDPARSNLQAACEWKVRRALGSQK